MTSGKVKKEMEDRKMGEGAEVRCGNDRWEVGRMIRRTEEGEVFAGKIVRGGHDRWAGG